MASTPVECSSLPGMSCRQGAALTPERRVCKHRVAGRLGPPLVSPLGELPMAHQISADPWSRKFAPRAGRDGAGEAPATALDLRFRMRRNRRAEWARRMVREHHAHHRRSDLAAVRHGRRQGARAGALDARRRAALGRPGGARSRTRGQAHHPLHRAVSLYRPGIARRRRQRGAQSATIWSAAPSAPSRRKCRRSASSATWRSIPSPATAMTACCATASSSMTRRWRCWSARRWCRRRPAATSSRPPT